MKEVHKLLVIDRNLYFPKGGVNLETCESDPLAPSLLIYRTGLGDIDLIPWPLKSEFRDEAKLKKELASALYDERETNSAFKYGDAIELPDGTLFDLDSFVS